LHGEETKVSKEKLPSVGPLEAQGKLRAGYGPVMEKEGANLLRGVARKPGKLHARDVPRNTRGGVPNAVGSV
jgi:hypothetical protein